MIVSDLTEVKITQVYSRGLPNYECIGILAKETINLGQYGIMIGSYSHENAAFPFSDNLFWFGSGVIEKGDCIYVYTGSGTPQQWRTENGLNNAYSVFWGKAKTVFANSNIVPILFRIDAVNVFMPPYDVPQVGDGNA